jgi:hypothetical protein
MKRLVLANLNLYRIKYEGGYPPSINIKRYDKENISRFI